MPRFIPNASTANHLRPAPGPPQRPFVIPRRIGRLLPSRNPPGASIAPSTVAIRAVVTVPRSVLPGLRLVLSAPCKTAAVCTKDSLPTPPDSVNFHLIARCLPREERWPGRSSAPLFHAASCPGSAPRSFYASSCCSCCSCPPAASCAPSTTRVPAPLPGTVGRNDPTGGDHAARTCSGSAGKGRRKPRCEPSPQARLAGPR